MEPIRGAMAMISNSPAIRLPAVAGSFYPDDPALLGRTVEDLLESTPPRAPVGTPIKAVIVPHAGYVYSGSTAGKAYRHMAAGGGRTTRVVIIGPAHTRPVDGIAASSASHFATPLGAVPVDRDALARLQSLSGLQIDDPAHRDEHCIEVHLPFLQVLIGDFTLVPLLVGQSGEAVVERVLSMLWPDPETLVVVSSDLSHFLDYAAAQVADRRTCTAIETLHGGLGPSDACGSSALNGMLSYARTHGLTAETVGLGNSGDTAGPRDRVVGYGAWVLS